MSNCNFSTGSGAPTAAPLVPAAYFDSASGFTYNWNLGTQAWVPIPKRYLALLSQSGPSAPTAVVLENTLGATVTWSRASAGNYTATPTPAAFTANRTAVTLPNPVTSVGTVDWGISASLNVETKIIGVGPSDSVLDLNALEILVYP